MPKISSHWSNLVIPMYNLSTATRISLAFKAAVGFFVVMPVVFLWPWPTALGAVLKCGAILLTICAIYAVISRVAETEINLDQGSIIQRRAYPMLFPEKHYKLGNFSLIKSALIGRSASWISVALSGVGGDLEIARFDPGNAGTRWDSLAASDLRKLLVERLNYRDLGFI